MTTKTDHWHEVCSADRDRLEALGVSLWYQHPETPVRRRYNLYRNRGYSPSEALAYVYAWARNMVEQKSRRVGHDTGAGGVI